MALYAGASAMVGRLRVCGRNTLQPNNAYRRRRDRLGTLRLACTGKPDFVTAYRVVPLDVYRDRSLRRAEPGDGFPPPDHTGFRNALWVLSEQCPGPAFAPFISRRLVDEPAMDDLNRRISGGRLTVVGTATDALRASEGVAFPSPSDRRLDRCESSFNRWARRFAQGRPAAQTPSRSADSFTTWTLGSSRK